MGWDFFDKVYCISVRERGDRQAEARRQFAAVGLLNRVEFFIVEKPQNPEKIERAIYESHINCIKKGLDADATHILIFEDDIIFDRFDAGRLEACTQYLTARPDWKLLLLGCMVSGLRPTSSSAVMKAKYRSLTHAYAMNRDFAREIAAIPWQGFAYDCLWCPYEQGVYSIYPSFAFQSDSPSDNLKYLNLDSRRRFFGGFHRVQKFNEFFCRNRTFIIVANAFTFILLAVLTWVLLL